MAAGRVSLGHFSAVRRIIDTSIAVAVEFRLVLGFKIAGLIGTKHTATDVTSANCPIELPQNSV